VNTTPTLTRRKLLKTTAQAATTAGAALIIGFEVPRIAKSEPEKKPVNPLQAWVRVDANGIVTLICSKSEMGQGISTALPMILGDELDVAWKNVRVEQAITNPLLYGDQGTGGSGSVAGMWLPLRQAGAAARSMLISAAAQRWRVDPTACSTKEGTVRNENRSFFYAELIEEASKLPVPDLKTVPLKKPAEFKYIGQPMPRKDIPSKTDGSAIFGLDVRVPGMVYAVVARCPVFGGKVKSFDASKAKAMKGVHDVFEIEAVTEGVHSCGGVAVVAESTYIALQARKQLQIEWEKGPHATESSETLRRQFRRLVDSQMKVVLNQGDVEKAMAAATAAKRVEADYELPFQAHACMEPMNCTVHIAPDSAEAWAPVQGPGWVVGVIAQVTKLPAEKIKVHTTQMGGGFGRRYQADFAIEAAQVAKRVGKPVQLVWSREDDMTHDFYRPASYHRMSGAVDDQGNITAWRHKSTSTSIAEWWEPKSTPESSELGCTFQMPYLTGSYRLEYLPAASGVPRAWWRSVEASSIAFVMESYLDELAHAAGVDPFEYRLAKLGDARLVKNALKPDEGKPLETARFKRVLQIAADKAGWGSPLRQGGGRGIACHFSFDSYAANVVEVAIENRNLRVVRIVSVVDIGTAVNPAGVRHQVESAIIYGLTAALKSEITIQNGGAVETNFNHFATLSMKETPQIDVHIVPSEVEPTGIGEPGLPPVAPALMNAVFAATGKRIRRLPFRPEDLA
jgi:isoquinoline 1-oxidoreductase subunit beta